jgi:hypothetical protein
MRILPHITDRDLALSQDEIVALQRRDLDILDRYGSAFLEQASHAARELGVRPVVMCNVATEDVRPLPLDWEGKPNASSLHPAVYEAARVALEGADATTEVVALMYDPDQDVLTVYTVRPD